MNETLTVWCIETPTSRISDEWIPEADWKRTKVMKVRTLSLEEREKTIAFIFNKSRWSNCKRGNARKTLSHIIYLPLEMGCHATSTYLKPAFWVFRNAIFPKKSIGWPKLTLWFFEIKCSGKCFRDNLILPISGKTRSWKTPSALVTHSREVTVQGLIPTFYFYSSGIVLPTKWRIFPNLY